MSTIIFLENGNDKLDCDTFTTIRAHNPRKYYEGAEFKVQLKSRHICDVVAKKITTITILDIDDYMAYLDSGYNSRIIRHILDKTIIPLYDSTKLDYCLLSVTNRYQRARPGVRNKF